MRPHDVLVVGGGLAGLSCALALARHGFSSHVLEAAAACGGRAGSFRHEATGDRIDLGPHIFTTEHVNVLDLLEELGTRARVRFQPDPLITVVEDGDPCTLRLPRLPPPLHLGQALAVAPRMTAADRVSSWRPAVAALRRDPRALAALDGMSAAAWLEGCRVSPRFTGWFWATVAMAILNAPLERCSAGALADFVGKLLGLPDFAAGFADCALDELFLPSAPERLRVAASTVSVGARVVELREDAGRWRVRLADGSLLAAPRCVLALPPADAEVLRPGTVPPVLATPVEYFSVYLWFAARLPMPRFWARAWSRPSWNCDFYDLTQIRSGWETRPSVVTSNIIHSQRLGPRDDDEIVARTLAELGEFVPAVRSTPLRHAQVNRIPLAVPCPLPGSEAARPAARTTAPGLYLAGDWTATGVPSSMESAVRSGRAAADALLRDAGRDLPSMILPQRPLRGLTALVSCDPRPR